MPKHEAAIIGLAEVGNTRRPAHGQTTLSTLCAAFLEAVEDAGLEPRQVDGLAVTSFTLAPDRAGDVAFRLGLSLRWITDAAASGAAGIVNIQRAIRAIEAGDASAIVVVCGDAPDWKAIPGKLGAYNHVRADYLDPIGYVSPNSLFALLTQRQMRALGLEAEDYAQIAVTQRGWAAENPVAVYREPLTVGDYLQAKMVADPLRTYDCVPLAVGANALVIADVGAIRPQQPAIRIRAIAEAYNHDHQMGDGLSTGLADTGLWKAAGVEPGDMDVACVYDDYPAMVIAQLVDLGITEAARSREFIHERIASRSFPVNTSGGMLSAGQAGSAGALLAPVEVARQLQGRAGARQIAAAKLGVASGYGHVLYRYGTAVSAVVMERAS